MIQHEQYMERCLELASQGLGLTAPNPMVGCVIVHDHAIIGEGYHHQFGGPHAEVLAIDSVKDKSLLPASTLYVNLEPCSHYGKTPPCAELIISMGIKKVVIGMQDPFPQVAGNGIKKLQQAGVEVVFPVLENLSLGLNRRFVTFHTKKRPYIILKWAQTLDGFMDMERPMGEEPQIHWITSETTRSLVHSWRSQEQAILIGTQTALNDNPRLNVRDVEGKNPIRIVIDKDLRLPHSLHLFDNSQITWIFNYRQNLLDKKTEWIKLDPQHDILPQMLEVLYQRNIQSVMVEGGRKTLESFITSGLWDEARVLTGIQYFHKGLKAPEIPGKVFYSEIIGKDRITFTKNIL